MTDSLQLVKGHGTENDFVVLPDLDNELELTPTQVRALCDRRAGIGADGVLRVVRTAAATEPEVRACADVAPFFMDYRNADGSLSEMCGNGVRVFARYLREEGLIGTSTVVATRGGPRAVWSSDDDISVDMGVPVLRPEHPTVAARSADAPRTGTAVDMPNPHVVVFLDSTEELQALDLTVPPEVSTPLPEGQNIEFVVRTGPAQVTMRVHERGVGETRSCGTGICAAVAAASLLEPAEPAVAGSPAWTVRVPGGTCRVRSDEAGSLVLTGPAVLVGRVEVSLAWLDATAATH